MPNLFKNRLSKSNYNEILRYLDGKKNFNQVASGAQKILAAIVKPEFDRTFTEQEQLFEMKTKLIIDKYVANSDIFDKFEVLYRTFMLGTAAQKKFFNIKSTLSGISPGGSITKSRAVDPFHNYNVEKWNKIALEHFADDKQNSPGFADEYRGMSLEEQKIQYKKDLFQFLEDPKTKLPLASEYRRDFGFERTKQIELTSLPTDIEYVPPVRSSIPYDSTLAQAKTSNITRFEGDELGVPLEVPENFNDMLNKFMSERVDAISLGLKGIQVDIGKFEKWLEGGVEGIALNLAIGFGVQKVLSFIAKAAHMTQHGEKVMDFVVTETLAGITLSMATGPLGVVLGAGALVATPIIKLINFLKSDTGKRRKANDTPESVYGTQFARVRSEDENGVATWYPAILASKDLWTGIGSKEQNIRINYGKLEDLFWRFNRDGTFSPYFKNPRYRMINAKDRDLTDFADEKQRMKYDPLRDFSLYTIDETEDMFGKLVEGKNMADFKETVDDRSKLPKYLQELISYRDDFEWIRKFNTGGENIGRHLDPADRSIRREFEHSALADPDYIKESGIYFDMMNDDKYKKGFSKYKGKLHENKALLEFFDARMRDLLRSQKIAAEETPGFLKSLKNIGRNNDTYNYTLYALDTNNPPANSLDELKGQINKTQNQHLTWYEQNYLEQKQIVRYFAKKLSDRALGGDIVHAVTYPHQKTYRMDPKNENTALNYHGLLNAGGAFRLKQPDKNSVLGNPPGPWSNSNEKTIPTWLYSGKYMGYIWNMAKKTDYIQASEHFHKLMETQFVAPSLRNPKFKPGELFKKSNPYLLSTPLKYKGVVGGEGEQHRYDRTGEHAFEETANEKRARLQAEKLQILKYGRQKDKKPFVPMGTAIKPPKKSTSGDPTRRNDSFYVNNKDFQWSFEKKRFIPNLSKEQKLKLATDKLRELDWAKQEQWASRGHLAIDHQVILKKKKGGKGGKTSTFLEVERLKKEIAKQRYLDYIKRSREALKDKTDKKHIVITDAQVKEKKKDKKPIVIPKPEKFDALREYLREQHNISVPLDKKITQKDYPWLAFTEKGTPALTDDPVLHNKLKLSDAYRVVTTKTGILHKAYDPSKVQPKFFQTHETSVVSQY